MSISHVKEKPPNIQELTPLSRGTKGITSININIQKTLKGEIVIIIGIAKDVFPSYLVIQGHNRQFTQKLVKIGQATIGKG